MRRIRPRKLRTGTEAERPPAGVRDRFYFETDTRTIHRDDGTSWTVFIPDIAITDTSVVASQAEMLALAAQKGDVAIRTDVSKCFVLAAAPASELGNWKELLTPPAPVLSVNGEVGAVVLDAADVGALDTDDFLLSGLPIDADKDWGGKAISNLGDLTLAAGKKIATSTFKLVPSGTAQMLLMNAAETGYGDLLLKEIRAFTVRAQSDSNMDVDTYAAVANYVRLRSHDGATMQAAAYLRGGYLELARGKLTGALDGGGQSVSNLGATTMTGNLTVSKATPQVIAKEGTKEFRMYIEGGVGKLFPYDCSAFYLATSAGAPIGLYPEQTEVMTLNKTTVHILKDLTMLAGGTKSIKLVAPSNALANATIAFSPNSKDLIYNIDDLAGSHTFRLGADVEYVGVYRDAFWVGTDNLAGTVVDRLMIDGSVDIATLGLYATNITLEANRTVDGVDVSERHLVYEQTTEPTLTAGKEAFWHDTTVGTEKWWHIWGTSVGNKKVELN